MKTTGTLPPISDSFTAAAHAQPEALLFLTRLYGETMQLLLDAQTYFSINGADDQAEVTPVEQLVYSSEMSRVTLRLSSILAWLMGRRAEYSGQITPQEAAMRFRLSFREACFKELPEMHHVLPAEMCGIITRSLELYRRVARLDAMIADAALH